MRTSAVAASLDEIRPYRDGYRLEMACQIIHDSIHDRPGWTREYRLRVGDATAGYGSIAVAGPWKEKPTIYEFHVAPPHRLRAFDLFEALLAASGAVSIETQSNDASLTVMLHAFASDVVSESILFHDKVATSLAADGATFRAVTPDDPPRLKAQDLDESADWLIEQNGETAGAGGILFHYNRPYGDIYMKIAESHRRRGLGSFLVQEMKRVCYEHGDVPAARCNVKNLASRKTLQKAGFVPCGHILVGTLPR